MGYSESVQWSSTSKDYDIFYGRSFDERGKEEINRLVLREYSRKVYPGSSPLGELIDDYLLDLRNGNRVLFEITPGFYQEGDNYRFFVPFDEATKDKIKASADTD